MTALRRTLSPDRALLDLFGEIRLTPTQRRIAHCLVQHAAAAAYLSAAEVAELAGVSQPSVTRFAVALGHDGYPALRRRLRELTAAAPGPADAGNELQHAVHAETGNLDRLAGQLADPGPDRRGRQAARRQPAAAGARPAGRRAARRVLRLLRRQGAPRRTGPRRRRQPARRPAGAGRAPPGRAPCSRSCCPATPGRPSTRCARARELGLTVVAITDSPVSPAAEYAEIVAARRRRHPARLRPAHRPDGPGDGAAPGDLRRRARRDAAPAGGVRSPPPPAASSSSEAGYPAGRGVPHERQPVRAAHGTTLTARGWPQEAALRMLMNNLDPEVAERPEDLVVYGGTGRAARDWPSYHALVRTLTDLATTRRCWCSPAARSGCCAPTSGRPGCCWPTPTWSATGPPGRSSAAWSSSA